MEPGPPPGAGGSPPSAPPERPPDPESPAQPKAFKRKIAVLSAAKGSLEPEGGGSGASPAVTSSLTSSGGRKRRWGASTACAPKRPSISITTDSLKSLIPEMKAGGGGGAEAVVELHPEEGPMSEEEGAGGGGAGAAGGGGAGQGPPLPPLLLPSPSPHHPPLKICRTVTQVVPAENGQEEEEEEEEGRGGEGKGGGEDERPQPLPPPAATAALPPTPAEGAPPLPHSEQEGKRGDAPRRGLGGQPRPGGFCLPVDDPVRAAPRPSPPRARPSPIVHLCNLVRPFTLGQLKELLGRTGRLREDGFWIDKIKSHCYVTYASVEEAVATRNALHGVKWPQSNPKVLAADFAEQEELDFHRGLLPDRPEGGEEPPSGACPAGRGGACPPAGGVSSGGRAPREAERAQWAEREREMERRERTRGEREWDRDKGPPRSPSPSPPAPRPPGHAPREPRPRHRPPDKERGRGSREARPDKKGRRGRGVTDGRGGEQAGLCAGRGVVLMGCALVGGVNGLVGGIHCCWWGEGALWVWPWACPRLTPPPPRRKPPEEPPAKLLDDLFRKTKAAPCIYWLPLTDTQFVQKQAERAARARERERRRKEQEEEEQRQRGGGGGGGGGSGGGAGGGSGSGPASRDKRGGGGPSSSSSSSAAAPAPPGRERLPAPPANPAAPERSHHHREHHRGEHRRGGGSGGVAAGGAGAGGDKRRSRSRSRSTPVRDRGGRR
ncbi:apoptotic chromatin condensation inducer in the nucleus [Buteo buteo]|uniref:apoptotic chromatin condensation inducer in the nucleus n=1 Tax=Buteo buteo TaxID=30397 RepID=UPI003EC0DBD4